MPLFCASVLGFSWPPVQTVQLLVSSGLNPARHPVPTFTYFPRSLVTRGSLEPLFSSQLAHFAFVSPASVLGTGFDCARVVPLVAASDSASTKAVQIIGPITNARTEPKTA